MKRHLELVLHLVAATVLWLLLPVCGVLSAYPPTLAMVFIIVVYGILTNYALRFLEVGQILLGARISSWKVFSGLFFVNFVVPFAVAELACLAMSTVELRSHLALLVAVVVGVALQFALMVAFGPLRERLHTIELLKPIKLRQEGEKVFRSAVRGAELVNTGLMLIEADQLEATMGQLMRAHKAFVGGHFDRADELMLAAIPELSGGGFLGGLRLQQAFYILKQSALAVGDAEMVSDCQSLIAMLEVLYRQGVVGISHQI